MHIKVSPFDGRRVMEHQEDARDGKDDKKKAGNAPQTECIRELKTMAFHLHGEDVKKKVMIH